MNRIKSIDGIRAIGIMMVLSGHNLSTLPTYLANNIFLRCISNSALGVKIFFVISGYLITKLLLSEKNKTGTVNIKHFYIRRIFRIFPVFYLYILCILILKWFFIPDIISNYYLALFAGLYLWNYKHLFNYEIISNDNGYWFFGHFWSLSMEEQFYLLWPLAFNKINKILLVRITYFIIFTMPLVRVLTYFLMPDSRGQLSMMLQTGGDTILTGCLGALLEDKFALNKQISLLLRNNYFVAFCCVILFMISPLLGEQFRGGYSMLIGRTLENFIILFLLLWSIYIPSLISKILNSKLFVYIGTLSYSLYIWQQLFLTDRLDYKINHFPLNLIMCLLVAMLSYHVIEKPILKFKNKFTYKPTVAETEHVLK